MVLCLIELAGVLVFGLGATALGGYAFNVPVLYGWTMQTPMAVPTAIGFALTGPAIFGLSFIGCRGRVFAPSEKSIVPPHPIHLIALVTLGVCGVAMFMGHAEQALAVATMVAVFWFGQASGIRISNGKH